MANRRTPHGSMVRSEVAALTSTLEQLHYLAAQKSLISLASADVQILCNRIEILLHAYKDLVQER